MFWRTVFICLLVVNGSLLSAETAQVETQATHRVFQFENEYVKVWKTVIMPHQPLKMHRHDCARVVVGLKGGTLTKIEETGETSELVFETGKSLLADRRSSRSASWRYQ